MLEVVVLRLELISIYVAKRCDFASLRLLYRFSYPSLIR